MNLVLLTPWISPHQLPLARECAKLLGEDEFEYHYTEPPPPNHVKWGWDKLETGPWCKLGGVYDEVVKNCECLLVGGIRPLELMENRAKKGLKTFYMSERWFKPILVGSGKWVVGSLPGWVRMFVPGYRKMVKRFVRWANTDPNARVLVIGPWAKKDFLRMGISLDKIVDWGYYVEPSDALPAEKSDGTLKLLWCGRLLGLKRVGDIVRAVGEHVGLKRVGDSLPNISLTIVGDGPEKARLMKMAKGLPITFMPPQLVWEIRELMRKHDTYVFASNQYEGWGAVVSEALEEGMNVIGTYEAGASATLLPKERLYHAGDYKALSHLIELEWDGLVGQRNILPECSIGEWTAKGGATKIMKLMGES